ncbi:MAG: HAD-IC family P-type ATPase [bacterium]|nr:HAD-IC family P-type ATPase [bacterium]
MTYHSQTVADILKELNTSEKGLTSAGALSRTKQYGPNTLPKSDEKMARFKILLDQFKSPLIFILVIAGTISGFLQEYIDMAVIFLTVGINTIIGFVQEDKASQALKKLRSMIEYNAIVFRDGRPTQIKSTDIVPGDVMQLDAGDKIQADGRIISSIDFETNEASLTGESDPVKKNSKVLKNKTSIADRSNMVFNGSVAVNGRARVLIVSTGVNTELGKIATLVKETEEEGTPLQIQLSKLGKQLAILVLFLSVIIFLLGVFFSNNGESLFHMFEVTVAVAVAAIPEGLAITLTVILAIGMRFILKRKALVRKLVAAETLGSVSVICTDKTGTITEGKMRLTNLITSKDDLDFSELKTLNSSKTEHHMDALFALRIGILANDGLLENSHEDEKKWKAVGDTTDIAFLHMGVVVGLHQDNLIKANERMGEIPFTSERKYVATMHHVDNQYVLYVKGAPEVLLKKCKNFEDNGKTKLMTKAKRDWVQEKIDTLTESGLRVLAMAYKRVGDEKINLSDEDIDDLSLVAIVGLSDPLRPDVKETIALSHKAGIKTVMITGDHVKTAQSIARQIGLSDKLYNIFDGQQMEKISDVELAVAVKNISIFARVDPIHKIRIVRAFQANGEVVAMTGDGVNDAPALKAADIGIALGSGSDVAKEIADMVLLDDAYSTIVKAVEQGRGIYQNVKKVILYLLASSFAEVGLVGLSLLFRLPLPVIPAQILWVNVLEDSFPNMALAFDKGDKENMAEGPRKKDTNILDTQMKIMIAIVSIISNVVLFSLYLYLLRSVSEFIYIRTMMFVGLGIDSLIFIYSVRSMRHMVWQKNPFDNNYLNLALLFSWVMFIGAVHWGPLQTLLRTVDLSFASWGVLVLFGLLNMAVIEIIKFIFLVRKNKKLLLNT